MDDRTKRPGESACPIPSRRRTGGDRPRPRPRPVPLSEEDIEFAKQLTQLTPEGQATVQRLIEQLLKKQSRRRR